mgnify:CR=1 FL=1
MVSNMGNGTLIKSAFKPKTKTGRRPLRLPFDVPLLLIVAILLVFGLLMVYSSSWDVSILIGQEPTYIFGRQVLWVILGIIGAIILSLVDYHRYEKFLVFIMIACISLLVIVLIINDVRFNSSRALLGGSIQPAELAKVVTILYLSFWLYKRQDDLKDINIGLLPLGVILGLIGGLIFIQPDISASATILMLGIMLFFLAGGDWKQIILVAAVILLAGGGLVAATPTGSVRISDYLSGLKNPIEGSYHIRRTFEAIIKGGVFGVGIGQADTKFTGLPLPHTDSIFAVVAEETGLIGAIIIIILFCLLLWRGFVIANRAPDQLGSLLAYGLTGWIALEALMNTAVIVGLFPFTGNALPFISAGGSSMMSSLAAIGIVMNIARCSVKQETSERSQTSAVVDLRRRDRRRRVPRGNRRASP